MTISTPSMGLQKPEVTVTPGPQWATDLNASLDLLDTHDHSNGKGVKITPAGININTNLTFNTNFATNAGGYQFAMVSAPTINDVLYVDTTGNLRYKNAMGDFPRSFCGPEASKPPIGVIQTKGRNCLT